MLSSSAGVDEAGVVVWVPGASAEADGTDVFAAGAVGDAEGATEGTVEGAAEGAAVFVSVMFFFAFILNP